MLKRIFLGMLALVMGMAMLSGCQEKTEGNPIVKLELEDGGVIIMELYPEIAPMSVAHVVENVKSKYYNGKVFHRAQAGFMIQGGSKDGFGVGGSDRTVKGEFSANGITNDLKHTRGVVSLARSQDMNSASGQFFIMHADSPHLDGQYAAFGKVLEGMDVVDRIATSEVRGTQKDQLVIKPVIKEMTILKGYVKSEATEAPKTDETAKPVQ